jgi:hypothetical protein
MPLVGTSLNAVTTTGPGSAVMFDVPRSPIGMLVLTTGSPDEFSCELEVSQDGVNWVGVANTNGGLFANTTFPALFARANLLSFGGGSSPTFTAVISAKG